MTETFTRPISGRDIEFRLPSDAQLLVLGRLLRLTERMGEDEGKIAGSVHQLSKVLDIIDSMIINEEDRSWVEDRILEGTLDLSAIMEVFRAEAEETGNRATKRAAKKTGTARARRA